ncbi:hypothetical protein [Salinibacter altiplanensis]|uniref:hypothetical protein n=1 Tax=Salinibacter altiplanensis TaxID=1803181 RepID=UPI0012FFDF89|nr:hypothetical protein [Salinibacter altiplanensis]
MRSISSIRQHWASTVCGAVLGLLLLIPVSPHAAELVLCLEPTGQVNVESAEAGSCADRPEIAGSKEQEVFVAGERDHCSGCSDIPLHLTEADDPCGTAITPPTTALDGTGEQLSLVSTGPAEKPFAAVEGATHSHLQASTSAPSESGPDASLGSVVLLV